MSTATTAQRTGNRVLDRLPPEEYALLLPSLEPVALPRGYEIYRQNGPMPHVYFPQRGLCSAVVAMRDGRKAEAGNIGSEGMVGIAVYLGLNISPIRSVSQVPGEALRAPADAFLRAARPGGTLDRLLKRYAAFSLRHAAQSSACNALHAVERRMARWLLMAHDR